MIKLWGKNNMAKELLTELKGGMASFTMIGTAQIKNDSLEGVKQKEGKTWKHVDSSFAVQSADGSRSFVRIYGGYKLDNPILKRFKSDGSGMADIPWKDRFNEELHEDLSPRSFFRAKIEKDEEGKLIAKQFISEIDFEEYLREHLEDKMEITVTGEIEYSPYGDRTFKNYNVKGVYLNEAYVKNGEDVEAREHAAFLRQTYLLDDMSLPKTWKSDLKKDGEVIVAAYVPQYLSSKKIGEQYEPYKKTDPISQPVIIRMNSKPEDETYEKELEAKNTIINKFFSVKRNKVREIGLFVKINEGFKTGQAELHIDKQMQELIDANVLTLEDVKSQMTVQGSKVDEMLYMKPVILPQEDGSMKVAMDDEKYAPEALIVPELDSDEEYEAPAKKEDKKVDKKVTEDPDDFSSEIGGAMGTDAFDKLFG